MKDVLSPADVVERPILAPEHVMQALGVDMRRALDVMREAGAFPLARSAQSLRLRREDFNAWIAKNPTLEPLDPKLVVRNHSVVYIVQTGAHDAPVKIGWSIDLMARVASFQAVNPYEVRILAVFAGNRQTEGALHGWFAKSRLHGEWFEYCEEIQQLVALAQRECTGKVLT